MSTARADSNNGLVSIVIPVYNGEKTIERALDSVVNQSYRNFEVIIIDDGSTDNTRARCLPYVEKYSNFTLLSIKNEGVSNARNVAVEMANGEYITFFDADDELMPAFLSESVDFIKETGSDIVCFNAALVASGGGTSLLKSFDLENYIVEDEEEKKIIISSMFYGRTKPGHYYGGMLAAPWAKLFRLEMIKSYSIKFPYGIRIGEDSVFLIYAFSAAKRIAFKNERLYKYYVLENSACHRYREDVFEERTILCNAAKKALQETNIEIENFENFFFCGVYTAISYHAAISGKSLREKIQDIVDGIKKPLVLNGLLLYSPDTWKFKIRRTLARLHCYHLLAFLELSMRKIRDLHTKRA